MSSKKKTSLELSSAAADCITRTPALSNVISALRQIAGWPAELSRTTLYSFQLHLVDSKLREWYSILEEAHEALINARTFSLALCSDPIVESEITEAYETLDAALNGIWSKRNDASLTHDRFQKQQGPRTTDVLSAMNAVASVATQLLARIEKLAAPLSGPGTVSRGEVGA